jgi:hypothetical protein
VGIKHSQTYLEFTSLDTKPDQLFFDLTKIGVGAPSMVGFVVAGKLHGNSFPLGFSRNPLGPAAVTSHQRGRMATVAKQLLFPAMGHVQTALQFSEWALESMLFSPLSLVFAPVAVTFVWAWQKQRPFQIGALPRPAAGGVH